MQNLLKALVSFHQQVGKVTKNAKADRYRYADLAQVFSVVDEPLAANGLIINQSVVDGEMVTTIWHISGESLESRVPMTQVEGRGMNAAQAAGSALSYARRYGILTALKLATEDDDAAATGQRPQSSAPASASASKQMQPAVPPPPARVVELVKAHNIPTDQVAALAKSFGYQYSGQIPDSQLDAFCSRLLDLVDNHAA